MPCADVARAASATARVTAASLRADLANARAANTRLQTELAALRRRLGQQVVTELAGDETTDMAAVAPRVAELEQALFEYREALAQRTEELEAARINRELLERLNRRTRS